MYKQVIRTILTAASVVIISAALVGCTTTNPHMRSDTGYGSTTIPTDHEEAVRELQRDRNETKKHRKLTPEERRALVEHYKEVLSDI